MAKLFGVSVEEILDTALPAPEREPSRRQPAGKVWKLFERVSALPRRQQEKVVEFVSAFVASQEAERAAPSERPAHHRRRATSGRELRRA